MTNEERIIKLKKVKLFPATREVYKLLINNSIDGVFNGRNSTLVTKTGLTLRTVQVALHQLIKHKLIERKLELDDSVVGGIKRTIKVL